MLGKGSARSVLVASPIETIVSKPMASTMALSGIVSSGAVVSIIVIF